MDASIRVLHVDDDPEFAAMVSTFLEREDGRFEVETTTSASEALDRIDDGVDCVVSDYDMPGTDGIEFLEAVRETHDDLPFILFTGKGSEEVASDAISAGVTDYLEKGSDTSRYAVLANRIGNVVDQYRSRRELEASRERLSLFFEQSPLGVVEWDEHFEIVRVNDAATDILGYDEDELVGESWERIVPEAETEAVERVVEALLADRGGYRSVNENVRADGERIVCEWHNRVVTDADGDTVGIFSQFQDITERRERKERLQRSTARLEALFENSPDMINVHDTDGNIIEPNPQLCEKTGYDAATLTDMKVWDLDQRIDPEEARAVWEEMDVGDRRRLEGVYGRRDGSTFPVEVHLRRLDLEGEKRFVVISRDISERKAREEDLEATKERLDTVVSNVPVVLFALDAEGVFTLSEGKGLSTLDLESGEVVGSSVFDLYGDQPDVIDAVERALDGEEVSTIQEVENRFYETAYQPVFDDGTVTGAIGVAIDITERRRRERELRRQNDRLEDFVGVVSHDLQTPLNVAAGRVELAREECESGHLDGVAGALDRMDELISDLLRLAREGERVNEIDSVTLADAVEDCWRNVETAGASLVVETSLTIRGDPGRLQHLLANLLQNAVEHGVTGTDDRSVTVTVGTLDDGTGFYVADDGPGIPESNRGRVFESGFSTAADGTGFGLAIAEEVAEAHGWSIGVTESAAGGARFEITAVDVVE
ncbi:PAS domain S-box protein [Haloplanus halophilus]|uniref:PAS domain S-box protein n=1 Tax=Haloplanus halophilus TaxID=2949993 RepID=UPI0020410062|nr:PAS domain S-box protein [Haloplanus sp. GDY1]